MVVLVFIIAKEQRDRGNLLVVTSQPISYVWFRPSGRDQTYKCYLALLLYRIYLIVSYIPNVNRLSLSASSGFCLLMSFLGS